MPQLKLINKDDSEKKTIDFQATGTVLPRIVVDEGLTYRFTERIGSVYSYKEE